MQPLSQQELERALEEAAHSGNLYLLTCIRRLIGELRELRDKHANAAFLQNIEESY